MATPKPKPGKRVWYRDPKILAVGGIGALAGLYVLAKNRGKGSAAGTGEGTDASSTGAIPGAPYSSLNTDLYNAVQDSTSALQDKLAGLAQSVQETNLRINQLNQQPPPSPGSQPPGKRAGLHRIGSVGRLYNIRDVAKRFAPNPNSPDSVEAELRRLVSANPSLKGKRVIPGGYALRVPRI